MSIYHKYTVTKKTNLFFVYKCSDCGVMNIESLQLDSSSSYNDKNIFANMNKKREKAQASAEQYLSQQVAKVLDKINQRDFRYLDLACSCRKCGCREPWSITSFGGPQWFQMIRGLMCAVAILITIFIGLSMIYSISHGDSLAYILSNRWIFIYLLATLCVFITPHIIYYHKYKLLQPQIEHLSNASLPHAYQGSRGSALASARNEYLKNRLATAEEFDDLERYLDARDVQYEALFQLAREKVGEIDEERLRKQIEKKRRK